MSPEDEAELKQFRQEDVRSRMERLSEVCWASNWYETCALEIYLKVFHGASPRLGTRGRVSDEDLRMIRRNAELTDTWWVKGHPRGERRTCSLAEAERRYGRIEVDGVGLTVSQIERLYWASPNQDDWVEEVDEPWLGVFCYHLKANPQVELLLFRPDTFYVLRYGGFETHEVPRLPWQRID